MKSSSKRKHPLQAVRLLRGLICNRNDEFDDITWNQRTLRSTSQRCLPKRTIALGEKSSKAR